MAEELLSELVDSGLLLGEAPSTKALTNRGRACTVQSVCPSTFGRGEVSDRDWGAYILGKKYTGIFILVTREAAVGVFVRFDKSIAARSANVEPGF